MQFTARPALSGMFVSRMIKVGCSVPGGEQQAGQAFQARSGLVSEFRSHCPFSGGPLVLTDASPPT